LIEGLQRSNEDEPLMRASSMQNRADRTRKQFRNVGFGHCLSGPAPVIVKGCRTLSYVESHGRPKISSDVPIELVGECLARRQDKRAPDGW
jgi:hypothetical protein